MAMTIPWLEIILGLVAFCFLASALQMQWHIGRLTITPGWLGLTIWGVMAALQQSAN